LKSINTIMNLSN